MMNEEMPSEQRWLFRALRTVFGADKAALPVWMAKAKTALMRCLTRVLVSGLSARRFRMPTIAGGGIPLTVLLSI